MVPSHWIRLCLTFCTPPEFLYASVAVLNGMCVNWNFVSRPYHQQPQHTAVWLLKWDSHLLPLLLCLAQPLFISFSLISPLSITFLPLINARGMCSRSRRVFECVFVSARPRLCTCYRVCCARNAAMACVCVCAYQIGRALISHAVFVFELKSCVWQRLVLKQRGPPLDKMGVPWPARSSVKLHSSMARLMDIVKKCPVTGPLLNYFVDCMSTLFSNFTAFFFFFSR